MTSQSYVIELVELCRMTQNQRDWTRFDKVMPLVVLTESAIYVLFNFQGSVSGSNHVGFFVLALFDTARLVL